MSLSFLAPLFLAGLAALAIPVIIHLRRQHERREMEFPSLMFLRDIPFRSERRRNIRHKLLLALRLLALALLVTAFARPFLQGDRAAAAGVVGPREIVLLVDRSWSMSYADHWERATDAAREVTASLGPQDRVTLILFDEGADAPVRSSPERDRVLRILDESGPTDRSTRMAPALRLARSVLETTRLPRREVLLISDFQESGWSADEDVSLPPGVGFRPVPVSEEGEEWTNVTVASVDLRTSRAGQRDAVVPTARILRRGSGGDAGSLVAVLEVEGRERERVEASLDGGGGDVTFGPVPLADRPLRATIRVEEDALPRDDAHHMVLSPGRRISVLVVEPAPARENASLYLRRALELSRDPPMQVDVTAGGVPSDLADGYDVVVLNDRPARGDAAALRELLEAGGGILWAPGAGAGGAGPGGGVDLGAGAVEIRDHDAGAELRLGSVDRDHPVFEPFRESGTGNFSAARFFRTWRLAPTDSARILARFDDGSPALVEARPGAGRVLTWASTLHTFWTDLPLQPVFVPFVHRAVAHLANQEEEIPSYRVGEVVALATADSGAAGAPERTGTEWSSVLTPDGERMELDEGAGPLVLEHAGFYELLEGEGDSGTPVAVNVDAGEGDLSRHDVEEVTAAVGPPRPADSTAAAGEDEALSGGIRAEDRERHQGMWRFLLMGAFLFLVGETALSNRLSGAGTRA